MDNIDKRPEPEIYTCVKAMAERIHEQESRISELEQENKWLEYEFECLDVETKELEKENRDLETRLTRANEYLEREGKDTKF